ncbi:rhodanese-like domain-containing protein [Candidatus Collierbacteria bacterium]|nr:rhodanese-like domain-containing protein [Candidatus Collierbacteria bacterium]
MNNKVVTQTLDFEIEVTQALEQVYSQNKIQLWKIVKQGLEATLTDNVVLLDVRTEEEYQDEHLPNSLNIDHDKALEDIKKLANKLKGKKVYSICRSGSRSSLVTEALRHRQIEAYNIKGGMVEWSRLNFPRIRLVVSKLVGQRIKIG